MTLSWSLLLIVLASFASSNIEAFFNGQGMRLNYRKITMNNELVSANLPHVGDLYDGNNDGLRNTPSSEYVLNVGKALEVLRRELPVVFVVQNLDFSIFSSQITVTNGNQNKLVMSKSLYTAAVRSMQMASAFSSIYPSMNVRKIEYVDDVKTIQCLVDVVLPDSVRVDGQAVWEGMFYFGLNDEGLIQTHIFDRKISNFKPQLTSVQSMPWLRRQPAWSADLLSSHAINTNNINPKVDFSVVNIDDIEKSSFFLNNI